MINRLILCLLYLCICQASLSGPPTRRFYPSMPTPFLHLHASRLVCWLHIPPFLPIYSPNQTSNPHKLERIQAPLSLRAASASISSRLILSPAACVARTYCHLSSLSSFVSGGGARGLSPPFSLILLQSHAFWAASTIAHALFSSSFSLVPGGGA